MTSKTRISGSRLIADTLKGYGVTHIFYVEAIIRPAMVEIAESGIKRIVTHSEKSAAYMADGYARISGKPGICMAQSVGAANLAAGLQDPYLGCSPVIAITGHQKPSSQHRNAYQEIAHDPLFKPVTKYNVSAINLEQLSVYFRQAFREASSGKPRPVHLDVLGHEGTDICLLEESIDVSVDEQFSRCPAIRFEPDESDISKAVKAIAEAERPVIVAGGGVRNSAAGADIVELAEMLSIPVASSADGKGTIPEDHPLSVGVVGTYSRWCANRSVAEADLVIFIGSQTGDQVTFDWQLPMPGTKIIQIDIDPSELGRNYPNSVGLLGDAKKTVRKLIHSIDDVPDFQQWARRTNGFVKAWQRENHELLNSDAIPIRPERLCKEISEILPDNAILVSDTGYSAVWTATMIPITNPGQTYIRAAGSLGWGFPGSLGAKCAAPERPVICFTGDGGFWYHISELETARRWNINTITVVSNNSGFGQSVLGIENAWGDRSGKKEEQYKFRDVNFARIAEEIDCMGIRVENPDDLPAALQQALKADVPVVIDVVTDLHAKAAPALFTLR
jgi:acetolactate synthase-1/2/3 large subunit